MSDAAGRHDRARDLPGRTRSGDVVDGVARRCVDPSPASRERAGHPGPGDS